MRRAQVATIDFITGFTIILVAIILAINLILNLQEPSNFASVQREAVAASESLMSAGYPPSWNSTTVVKAGLLTDHKLNRTKLQQAAELPYGELKAALNVHGDIYWYFINATQVLNLSSCGYGSPDITVDAGCEPSFDPDGNLVRIDRFVTYNDTILIMVVIAWD